jgi:hypothetical protein
MPDTGDPSIRGATAPAWKGTIELTSQFYGARPDPKIDRRSVELMAHILVMPA